MSDLPDRISTGELRDKADQMGGEMGRQHAANLPRYRSHKEVQAVKIGAINYDIDLARAENRDTDGSAVIGACRAWDAADPRRREVCAQA